MDGSARNSPISSSDVRRLVARRWGEVARRLRDVRRGRAAASEELVHDLRVALRRADATLAVFRDRLPADRVRRLRRKLRELLRRAGRVRDWDVLARLLRRLRDRTTKRVRRRLARRWRRLRRRDALGLSRAARRSRRERLARSVRRLARSVAVAPQDDVASRLGVLAAAVARSAANYDPSAPDPEGSASHRVRRRARRLRYRLESLVDLLAAPAPPPLAELLEALRELQDRLGARQDAVVQRRLWSRFVGGDPALEKLAEFVLPRPAAEGAERAAARQALRRVARLAERLAEHPDVASADA